MRVPLTGAVGSSLVVLSLACGGAAADVTGTWCTQGNRYEECLQFEGATVLNTYKGASDSNGTYTVEGDRVVLVWKTKTQVYQIVSHSPSQLQLLNDQTGDKLFLIASPHIER